MTDLIELTISSDYVKDWDTWCGIRELVQNAIDAQDDGFPMEIDHDGRDTLTIRNKGAWLDRSVLLLGETSKKDREDQRGQFGEGLKLGILALLREKRIVYILNGKEIWAPILTFSDKFNREILAFQVSDYQEEEHDLTIRVGISLGDWEVLRERFLFLCPKYQALRSDYSGFQGMEALLDEDQKSKIYYKGIYVETNDQFKLGYNLVGKEKIDRDRNVIHWYDLRNSTSTFWRYIDQVDGASFEQRVDMLYMLLAQGANDVAYISNLPVASRVYEGLWTRWIDNHGLGVPTSTTGETKQIQAHGLEPTITTESMVKALLPDGYNELLKKRGSQVKKTWQRSELSIEEKNNLSIALNALSNVYHNIIEFAGSNKLAEVSLDEETKIPVHVADFHGENIYGLAFYNPFRIFISKTNLSNLYITLGTLIHEVSHYYGLDGELSHVRAIENSWQRLSEKLNILHPPN